MGDVNAICTLVDYSKPSHEGYRNTIELPEGNNVVPLRSDTILLVQNGCSFHGHRSEDPNQHLKDFLKLMDSLDLDGENRERMRMLLSTEKDCKTLQRYPNVPTTSRRISLRSMDSRTIDQSTGGKLRDRNAKESWALLEDLALYDNESWNNPRDFAKPVKAISLPQDVPNLQWVPHDRHSYCMENLEQAFFNYASSRIDEAGGKRFTFKPEQNNLGDTYNPSWKSHPILSKQYLEDLVSNFMASQVARLSKFEAGFKQQQSEMTNKIDTVLKAITDRITRALPSDTIKNLKLNILKVIAHAPMYNAILNKYVESLELGKNGSVFIQGEMPKRMEDPGLFTLPCRLGDSKPFDTFADLGSCMNIIPLYLFKKFNIGLLEETDHVFGLANGTKSYPIGIVRDVEVHIGRLNLVETRRRVE
ncbi:MAK10-like protein [Tanacetum coccineum]